MAGLALFEKGIHTCGYHLSLTQDKDNHFKVDESECPLCAALARYDRMQKEADQQELTDLGGEKAPPQAPRLADGRVVHVRPKATPVVEALGYQSPPRE